MKRLTLGRRKSLGLKLALAMGLAVALINPGRACTIFVLTDASRALFFNNEDWSNPASRLWFVPAGEGFMGCAYVGFDNGWAQGGVNTAGLAFDWVTGFPAEWPANPGLKLVRGNPSQRMLETCSTVNEAIAFYWKYWEPDFARSRILVADRTGASAIISAQAGRLQVERSTACRGFGYGHEALDRLLARPPEPTVANGLGILRETLQTGEFATKYSSVYDLKTGDLFIAPMPTRPDAVKLNLAAELARGPHYYEMPRLQEQLAEAPRPLPPNMQRFYLDNLKPLPDAEPLVTAHLRALGVDIRGATMRESDYTPELWQKLGPAQKQIQEEMKALGHFQSLTLVGRTTDGPLRSYLYLLDFSDARVLQRYVLDPDNKVAQIGTDYFEAKVKDGGAAN